MGMPSHGTQAWAPARTLLTAGPSSWLLLLALVPSTLCLSPEKESQTLPGKESSGLRDSQTGVSWDPKAGDGQQQPSPDLGNKGVRFPDPAGPRRSRHSCRRPDFQQNVGSGWNIFGSGTQLTVLIHPQSAPTVYVFALSQDEPDPLKTTLVCLMSDFYPGIIEVVWTKDGVPVVQDVETSRPSRQSDNKYSAISYLTLSTDEWMSANTYSCKVTHDSKVIQKELFPSQCT